MRGSEATKCMDEEMGKELSVVTVGCEAFNVRRRQRRSRM